MCCSNILQTALNKKRIINPALVVPATRAGTPAYSSIHATLIHESGRARAAASAAGAAGGRGGAVVFAAARCRHVTCRDGEAAPVKGLVDTHIVF